MSAYVFYCSKCKFDHAGECESVRPKGDSIRGSDLALRVLEELIKALEAGNYNAAPTELKQGSELNVEDLEATLKNVIFYEVHVKKPRGVPISIRFEIRTVYHPLKS